MEVVELASSESEIDESVSTTYQHEKRRQQLGKRLAYLLRYGAQEKGLNVLPGGYVSLTELIKLHMMRHDSKEDVLKQIEEDSNARGERRFERKDEGDTIYVRACYASKLREKPLHRATPVTSLLDMTINYVADNIRYFDLQDFPDEYLIKCIMTRLVKNHRLNNTAFDSLLGSSLETLDLSDVMLTRKTLLLIGQRCSHLKHLNLRNCNYIVTDHNMQILLKKLNELESINLCGCCHLSDRIIDIIVKCCPNLTQINLIDIPNISEQGILHLLTACEKLKQLDISNLKSFTDDGLDTLAAVSEERDITININESEDISKVP